MLQGENLNLELLKKNHPEMIPVDITTFRRLVKDVKRHNMICIRTSPRDCDLKLSRTEKLFCWFYVTCNDGVKRWIPPQRLFDPYCMNTNLLVVGCNW